MSVLVTDAGFQPVPKTDLVQLADIAQHQGAAQLSHTDAPESLAPYLDTLTLICITFPAFNDGRAFTVARRLRALGYQGTLRAVGPVIADQYAMARRVGFDQVEIPDDLAQRQPEDQWLARADWRENHYLARLKA
ncbi:MAG: DUF934 domain-containing protein [Cypionkella sp.]|nr:DUF934 domain-containing protein [Cypionkella sp.]